VRFLQAVEPCFEPFDRDAADVDDVIADLPGIGLGERPHQVAILEQGIGIGDDPFADRGVKRGTGCHLSQFLVCLKATSEA
jgi:hypothetical protein